MAAEKGGVIDILMVSIPPLIGVGGLIVGWWLNHRRPPVVASHTRQNILEHPVFDRLQYWKGTRMNVVDTGSPRKDQILKRYAEIMVEIIVTTLRNDAEKLDEAHKHSVVETFVSTVELLDKRLVELNFPLMFLDKLNVTLASSRSFMCEEVLLIQDSEAPYLTKVYQMYDKIRVLVGLILNDIVRLVSDMNGTLEAELQRLESEHKLP